MKNCFRMNYLQELLFFLFIFLSTATSSSVNNQPFDLLFVTMGLQMPNPKANLYETYDTVLDDMAISSPSLFPLFSFRYLNARNTPSCSSSLVIVFEKLWKYLKDRKDRQILTVVLLTTECESLVQAMADIAREEDLLVLTSLTPPPRKLESLTLRYSNLISFADITTTDIAWAFLDLMDYYRVAKFAIVCSKESSDDLAITETISVCRSLQEAVSVRYRDPRDRMLSVSVDLLSSTEQLVQLSKTLQKFRPTVIGFACAPEVAVRILTIVDSANPDVRLIVVFPVLDRTMQQWTVNPYWTSTEDNVVTNILNRSWFMIPQSSFRVGFHDSPNQLGIQSSIRRSLRALAEVLSKELRAFGRTPRNASDLSQRMRNRSYSNPQETFLIDSQGLRQHTLLFQSSNRPSLTFTTVLSLQNRNANVADISPVHQNGSLLFFNQLAIPSQTVAGVVTLSKRAGLPLYIVVIIASVSIVALCILIFILIWRRQTSTSQNKVWLMPPEEVLVQGSLKMTVGTFTVPITSPLKIAAMIYKKRACQGFALPASFWTSRDVKKNKAAIWIMKRMMSFDHTNISKFYGLLWRAPHPEYHDNLLLVWECGERSSLRAVIDNDDYALNWDLRFSIIWDLIKALNYIHRSSAITALRCHGILNSYMACTLDKNFTLTVSQANVLVLVGLLMDVTDRDGKIPDDPGWMLVRLWTAPEAFVDPKAGLSPAADIYSLGVILYEMATRNVPYNVNLADEEQLREVSNRVNLLKIFDPTTIEIPNCPPELVAIIRACWAKKPSDRPTISKVVSTLNKAYPQREGLSLEKSLMERLMHYSQELEALVGERTTALLAEAKRVDTLLQEILPGIVARNLRRSIPVDPELYRSVTILFTDIPVLEDLANTASPFKLMAILDDVYTAFDLALRSYNVYKVETVGHTYVVASGVPEVIGNRHVIEIASLALRFMEAPIRSHGHHLTVRMGIYSGPVVAAVIGLKLPRYCLIGDTMNMASRMMSQGEDGQIQIGEPTNLLLTKYPHVVTVPRGLVHIKGKEDWVTTHWLVSAKTSPYL